MSVLIGAGMEASRAQGIQLSYWIGADRAVPDAVRDSIAAELAGVDSDARLTVALLARALVAACLRREGGTVHVAVRAGAGRVRVEVSGEGTGFRLPGDQRAHLIDRLADRRGVDEAAGVAWVELDQAPSAGSRRDSGTTSPMSGPSASAPD